MEGVAFSRGFISWLRDAQVSLVLSSYKTGQVLSIGLVDDKVSIFSTALNRPMGMSVKNDSIWIGTAATLIHFVKDDDMDEEFDSTFVPRTLHVTNDVDIHDIVEPNDLPFFISATYSCLAIPSITHSLQPIWKPKWITKIAGEDRCHLNGIAFDESMPAYATAVARSDTANGWQAENRKNSGVVVDMRTGEIVCENLTMPHSPRLYRGRLFVLDSGTGYFGHVNLESREFEKLAFLPGFARGMQFVGKYAVIGISEDRHEGCFSGLPLGDELKERKIEAKCGIVVVDLVENSMPQFIYFPKLREVYDVGILSGVTRPRIIGVDDRLMSRRSAAPLKELISAEKETDE